MSYPNKILLVRPKHFRVEYSINNHMKPTVDVDREKAMRQWQALYDSYLDLGFEVLVFEDHIDFPDMVFSANPIFSFPRGVILSRMKYEQRKPEVNFYKGWLSEHRQIQADNAFEGMGDLLWDYEGMRLFGGYGFRTDVQVYDQIEKVTEKEIIRLKLINEDFYHLDTCLSILNSDTALYVKSAFSTEDRKVLEQSFSELIQVNEKEAKSYLACNAHCPNGKDVILEVNAIKLQQVLRAKGFAVIGLDTSEFLKSGGSIFCMKNQGWF